METIATISREDFLAKFKKHQGLKEFAILLMDNGFDIIDTISSYQSHGDKIEGKTYFSFSDGTGIGYVQIGFGGYSLSSEYISKPYSGNGSGKRKFSGLGESGLTIENAEKTQCSFDFDHGSIRGYKDVNEFISRSIALKRVLVK